MLCTVYSLRTASISVYDVIPTGLDEEIRHKATKTKLILSLFFLQASAGVDPHGNTPNRGS